MGFASSCKHDAPSATTQPSASTSMNASAPATASARVPAASASAAAPDELDRALKDVVVNWNAAINAKDIAALTALHMPNVRFYGVMVDKATYGAKMKAALAKDPTFHQEVDKIHVERAEPKTAKVAFSKNDGKAVHSAYLVVVLVGGGWMISEESDVVTDARLKCVNSADSSTLTGTIQESGFIWHESVTPTTVLVLDTPICVLRSSDDDWGEWMERAEDVDRITIATAKPTLPDGTWVRVTGRHLHPHVGSGHYSTVLLLDPDSVTPCVRIAHFSTDCER